MVSIGCTLNRPQTDCYGVLEGGHLPFLFGGGGQCSSALLLPNLPSSTSDYLISLLLEEGQDAENRHSMCVWPGYVGGAFE